MNFCLKKKSPYSDPASVNRSLKCQWFIHFDLMKLTSFYITVTTFVTLRNFSHIFSCCIKQWLVIWLRSVVFFTSLVISEETQVLLRPFLTLRPSLVQPVSILRYPEFAAPSWLPYVNLHPQTSLSLVLRQLTSRICWPPYRFHRSKQQVASRRSRRCCRRTP
jgi:hypothetical protein